MRHNHKKNVNRTDCKACLEKFRKGDEEIRKILRHKWFTPQNGADVYVSPVNTSWGRILANYGIAVAFSIMTYYLIGYLVSL